MDLKITIRKIDSNDIEFVYNSICALENEVLNFQIFQEIYNENITNPHNLYLIAEANNEKVGFISFHTQNLLHHCGPVGEIQEFYITQNYRGKGIGRLLIDKTLEFAKQNGLKSIEVTTNKNRKENIAIYQNLGFSLTHNKFTINT